QSVAGCWLARRLRFRRNVLIFRSEQRRRFSGTSFERHSSRTDLAHGRHRRPRGQRLQLRHYGRGSALYSQSLSSSQIPVFADLAAPFFRWRSSIPQVNAPGLKPEPAVRPASWLPATFLVKLRALLRVGVQSQRLRLFPWRREWQSAIAASPRLCFARRLKTARCETRFSLQCVSPCRTPLSPRWFGCPRKRPPHRAAPASIHPSARRSK